MRPSAAGDPQRPHPAEKPINPLRFDVNVVLVPVVVTDVLNHPVTGLEKQNFSLFDNDQEREIQYFSTEDEPISIGLLLDLSKSMTTKFDAERLAVSDFFKNANSADDYFVVTFSTHPQLVTDATQSIATIQAKLGAATPDGSTAMLDAISVAMNRMRFAKYKRRAILIISDGGDNHSRHGYREIKALVRDSDVQVFAIGLFDSGIFNTFEEFMGKKWLSDITDATGGRTVTIDDPSKMGEAAASVSSQLRNVYVLGYWPGNAVSDGKRRRIKVRVNSPLAKDVRLQPSYRTGYVIPKQQ